MKPKVRHNDIKSAIFRPKNPKNADTNDSSLGDNIERDVVVYTMSGENDYLDDSNNPILFSTKDIEAEDRDNAYAKTIRVNDNNLKYFVRRDSSGKFFDPIGMYSEKNHNKLRHHTQDRQWEWVEVNVKSFEYYLRYLTTRNKAHLINAEREDF